MSSQQAACNKRLLLDCSSDSEPQASDKAFGFASHPALNGETQVAERMHELRFPMFPLRPGAQQGGSRWTQLSGRLMTARDAEKSQQCYKCFLQCTFASQTPQVRTWGRQICFLPWAPSDLVVPPGSGSGKQDVRACRKRSTIQCFCGVDFTLRSPVI